MMSRKISIGTLSKETNIPVSTIRTWEARYGVPSASGRTKGNHRLYDVDVVEHLKLINQALEVNTRASEVVPLPIEELRKIGCKTCEDGENSEVCQWLQLVHDLDERGLHSSWQRSLSTLGLEQFIIQRMIPFVKLIGEEWGRGNVHVFEEHFATEKIVDFLTSVWRSINKHNQGEKVILAGLPHETHTIGLHFAACFLVVQGYDVMFLGTNTPREEVVQCANKIKSKIVVFSISATYKQDKATEYLTELQKDLPPFHRIIVGGQGAPQCSLQIIHCTDLTEMVGLINQPTF